MTSQAAGTRGRWQLDAETAAGHALRETGAPDTTRRLQLALGFLWLLNAILQFQQFMFGRGFAGMLRATAPGNPAVIAGPINWSASFIDQHAVTANAAFATIQLLIGLGIAWRPTVKLALGLSVAWAVAVWWLGEGLGGLLTGTASPVTGAPGAVIIYALLAVLLWPRCAASPVPFAAARQVGAAAARALWLLLWGGLAWLALLPATSAPRAIGHLITSMSAGQPGWLARLDAGLAGQAWHDGPAAALVLAFVCALIAASIYLHGPVLRAMLILATAVAASLWLAGGLGGMLTGTGTDPGTGPLLALLAMAYWPQRVVDPAGEAVTATPARGA